MKLLILRIFPIFNKINSLTLMTVKHLRNPSFYTQVAYSMSLLEKQRTKTISVIATLHFEKSNARIS